MPGLVAEPGMFNVSPGMLTPGSNNQSTIATPSSAEVVSDPWQWFHDLFNGDQGGTYSRLANSADSFWDMVQQVPENVGKWFGGLKDQFADAISKFEAGQTLKDQQQYSDALGINLNHDNGTPKTAQEILFELAKSDPAYAEKYANLLMQQELMNKQQDWEKMMSDTAFQRQMVDIEAAGYNPWLALQNGSSGGASTPSTSAPSVGYASPSYQQNQREINESKITSSEKIAKDNNRTKIITSIISGLFGMMKIFI